MRNLNLLDRYRIELVGYVNGDDKNGAFEIPLLPSVFRLRIIASSDCGWDHVSVSVQHRCPTWSEMEMVRRLFFRDTETVMQLHPPIADYINEHPFCLHLWRPLDAVIPRPPGWMVGGVSEAEAEAEVQRYKAEHRGR